MFEKYKLYKYNSEFEKVIWIIIVKLLCCVAGNIPRYIVKSTYKTTLWKKH